MSSVKNFVSNQISTLKSASSKILTSTFLSLAAFMLVSAPLAAQEVLTNTQCAGTIVSGLSCTSNDIVINDVSQMTVGEGGSPEVTSCTEGDDTGTIDVKLTTGLNATQRYDSLAWFGQQGNDPRDTDTNALCHISSLPNDPVEASISDQDGDACLDVGNDVAEIAQYFYDVPFTCVDNFGLDGGGDPIAVPDGEADVFALITWAQNSGTIDCGIANADGLSPSNKPKCDISLLTGLNIEIILVPGLDLVKSIVAPTVDPATAAGQVVSYSYDVINTGDQDLTNITLVDDQPDANPTLVSCTASNDGVLQIGETCTYTATHTITQAEMDSDIVDNIATADSDETGPTQSAAALQVAQAPALNTVKVLSSNADEDTSSSITLNDTLTYTITVTNTGNVTLNNVVVTDSIITPTGGTTPCLTVDVGATCTLVGTYVVTQADVDAGNITNTGTGDSDETPPDDDQVITPIAQAPALNTVKVLSSNADEDTSSSITLNDTLTYTITVTNTGNVTLNNVVVTDNLITPTGGTTPCATVAVGATCTLVGTYVVTQADVNTGSITNTGTGDSDETPPDDDQVITPIAQAPALNTVKVLSSNADEDTSSSITLNDTLTYTITVTNTGNVTLNNVVVTDNLITPTGGTTPCATVAVGATCTLVGTYVVTQADVNTGSITNTGTGDSDETPPDDDQVITPIAQAPALNTVKVLTSNADEDASNTVTLSDTLTYTITVTNTGNLTLNNVVVTDNLITPTGGTTPCATVAVGATCTLVGTYVVTQANVNAGNVTNTGTGDSDETGPDSDVVVTPVIPPPPPPADPAIPVPVNNGWVLALLTSLLLLSGWYFGPAIIRRK